jgi:DNA polymerase sigma
MVSKSKENLKKNSPLKRSSKSNKKVSKKNKSIESTNNNNIVNGISKMKRNSSGNGSLNSFIPLKKSKKAKNKDRKKEKEKEKEKERDNDQFNTENLFTKLQNNNDDDDQSDDEIIKVSDASISDDDSYDNIKELGERNADKDLILLDSDSDNDGNENDNKNESDGSEVINFVDDNDNNEEESEGEDENENEDEGQPPAKKQKIVQGNMNDDYIAFDFSSDDQKDDYSEYDDHSDNNFSEDDNEYLSNDEGSYHSKNIKHKAGAVNDDYPWIRNSDHSKEREMSDWLTSEIKDFVKYISPSIEEIKSRNKLIENLKSHIKSIWPDAELHCFGSFATDLYLPGSDIDCVVVSKRARYDNKSSLYQLTSYIRNHKLGIEVTPIAKAKVPIIKFVDPKTKIHIDISFERSNGLKAAKLIIDWLASTPGLRELVLIVKQFLAVRKLNEVHVGGLGGFSIICLCYSFLKLHPRLSTNNIDPLENLGCLLIEFFELYGYNFGYDKVALAFTPQLEPIYVPKNSNPELLGRNPFSLAIQDPHDSSNNISRGSFNLRDIKRAFGGAFELLVNQCYELNSATYKQRLGKSILGGIIRYKGKQRDFVDARVHVKNVALHAATNEAHKNATKANPVLKKSGFLPPLPSEKAGLNPDEYFMSDSYYTEEDSDGENTLIAFESSQKPNSKKSNTSSKEVEKLLSIKDKDDNNDDSYTPEMAISKKEPDFTDSDNEGDDYDPSISASAALFKAKRQKRDYWSQKSGNQF